MKTNVIRLCVLTNQGETTEMISYHSTVTILIVI